MHAAPVCAGAETAVILAEVCARVRSATGAGKPASVFGAGGSHSRLNATWIAQVIRNKRNLTDAAPICPGKTVY